jgi:hypothetical protein
MPKSPYTLWLNNGVLRYWKNGWKAIAGGNDSSEDTAISDLEKRVSTLETVDSKLDIILGV